MRIPEAALHIGIAGGVEVKEDGILASESEPVRGRMSDGSAGALGRAMETNSDRKCEISANVGSFSARHRSSSRSASSAILDTKQVRHHPVASRETRTDCHASWNEDAMLSWPDHPHRRPRPSDGYGWKDVCGRQ